MFTSGCRWMFASAHGYLLLALLMGAQAAQAQFAVIDVASVTQLVTQLQTLQQQLATARDQLTQTRAQLQAMSGRRGMERLLSGTVRNYLPSDWSELERVLRGDGGVYGAMSLGVRRAVESNAVLSSQQLATLTPRERQQVDAGRKSAAMLQVMAREALTATSARFRSVQQLIDAISSADDQKAILDLQARIDAEQGMLQNEQTKLQVLYQSAQAQQWINEQRMREQAIEGYGRFQTRFQPVAR